MSVYDKVKTGVKITSKATVKAAKLTSKGIKKTVEITDKSIKTSKTAKEFVGNMQLKKDYEDFDYHSLNLYDANDLYTYCVKKGYGEGTSKQSSIKHFKEILERIDDESILFPFMGLYNYESMSKHDGTYAFLVTNKNIYFSQGSITKHSVYIIDIQDIKTITKKESMTIGILIISTNTKDIHIGINSHSIEEIFDRLKVLREIK